MSETPPDAEPTLADEDPHADYDAESPLLPEDAIYADPADGFEAGDPADVPHVVSVDKHTP